MNLFLLRHSIAEDYRPGLEDFNRALTPAGKELIERAAGNWKKLATSFDFIVSSPLIRAMQTAEIVRRVYGMEKELIIDRSILSHDVNDICILAQSLGGKNILFVGHQPTLAEFTQELVANGRMYLDFKKAMLVKINFEGRPRKGCGMLEAVIPAKMF